jgi:hypothetical protein
MMKSSFFNILLLPVLILALASCSNEDADFKIGKKYLVVNTNVALIDTFTVHTYTVKLDSITTSGLTKPALVVGQYNDPEFGVITSKSYFRLMMPTSHLLPAEPVYDSIRFFMVYNQYYAGDTTKPLTLSLHKLKESIIAQDDGYFYNNGSLSYDPPPLGSVTFKPEPIQGDTVWIKIKDDFGLELFNHFLNEDNVVLDNSNFSDAYPGFVLDYGSSLSSIIGFKFPSGYITDNPAIRMYYHYFDRSKYNKYFAFTAEESGNKQFNHFGFNGSPLVDFPTKQYEMLSSKKTNDKTFVMAGVGLITRIEIPYLRNLYRFHKNAKIIRAILEIVPAANTYRNFELPDSLCLYTSDMNNRFSGIIKTGNYVQYGNLIIDDLYQDNTCYTYDITNYVNTCMDPEYDGIPSLLLTVPTENLNKTVERAVLASQDNIQNSLRLKIYYLYY